MFETLYNSGLIPAGPINSKTDFIAAHAEVPRPEYNYTWNSDGLRSIDFATKPEIIALGCSLTLGQGLPVNLRWTDLLSKKINKPIGNISYSGAAINKLVSSFFGLINKYDYVPKTVICNFANFERFYFVTPSGESMQDWYINYSPKVTKASAPWNYEEILPYEWVYYQNLEHIKMLEVFCKTNNINLIWSTWSNALSENNELFLSTEFKNYVKDITRADFPKDFEFTINGVKIENLLPHYKMINWEHHGCHKDYYENYKDLFDYAYDYHAIPYDYGRIKGPGSHRPHPGLHRQLHWADFYYQELTKRNWL